MKKISLKLNTELHGKKEGTILKLEVDVNKMIKDRYWRRRLEDAKIDNCVEIVKNIEVKNIEVKKGDK